MTNEELDQQLEREQAELNRRRAIHEENKAKQMETNENLARTEAQKQAAQELYRRRDALAPALARFQQAWRSTFEAIQINHVAQQREIDAALKLLSSVDQLALGDRTLICAKVAEMAADAKQRFTELFDSDAEFRQGLDGWVNAAILGLYSDFMVPDEIRRLYRIRPNPLIGMGMLDRTNHVARAIQAGLTRPDELDDIQEMLAAD